MWATMDGKEKRLDVWFRVQTAFNWTESPLNLLIILNYTLNQLERSHMATHKSHFCSDAYVDSVHWRILLILHKSFN